MICPNVRGDTTQYCTLNCDHGDDLATLARLRWALEADTGHELVLRLVKIANIYDPADDWLIAAAGVVSRLVELRHAVENIPVRVVLASDANGVEVAFCKGHNALRDQLQKELS